jgi:hypothetical protein
MVIDSFTIALSALATYRVVRLIGVEEGPFSLAQKLRNVADPDQRTWVGRGLACAWCLSFWIAPVTLYVASYDAGAIVVGGLAISALVGLAVQCSGLLLSYAERLFRRGHGR